jgi:hypothetical protein
LSGEDGDFLEHLLVLDLNPLGLSNATEEETKFDVFFGVLACGLENLVFMFDELFIGDPAALIFFNETGDESSTFFVEQRLRDIHFGGGEKSESNRSGIFGTGGGQAGGGEILADTRFELGFGHLVILLGKSLINFGDVAFFEFLEGHLVATGLAAQGGLGKIGGKFDFHRSGFSWVHSKKGGNESGEEGVGLEPEPKFFGFGDLARVGGELEDLFTTTGAFEVDDGKIAFLGGARRDGMEVGHRLGEAGEGGCDIGVGDGFGGFLGNFEAFRSGQFKFRGKIDAEDELELFVLFEICFFDGGIVDEVKFFGFDCMAEAVAEKIFAEFFFNIVGVAATNHF